MNELAEQIPDEAEAPPPKRKPNRKERRAHIRGLRSMMRPIESLQVWEHPLTEVETPYAARERMKRRARNRQSRRSRKRNAPGFGN